MKDFFDNDDDNEFDGEDEFLNFVNKQHEDRMKFHKNLFIHDVEKFSFQRIPLEPYECEQIFEGVFTDEDMNILTQVLVRDYMKWWDNEKSLIFEKWGLSWVSELLEYNVRKEEYELCHIFKQIMESGKKYFKGSLKEKV